MQKVWLNTKQKMHSEFQTLSASKTNKLRNSDESSPKEILLMLLPEVEKPEIPLFLPIVVTL